MKDKGYNVKETGFWIDVNDPWLGGSPDGEVETLNEGVGNIEIKCPYIAKDTTITDILE